MGNNILSQEEIDALLNSEEDPVHPSNLSEKYLNIRSFDFRRPNKFSKEFIRLFRSIHEKMARTLSSVFSLQLRQDIKVKLTYLEQHTYSEFLDYTGEDTIFYVISFLNDQAIIAFDIHIALLLIEKILGGRGKETHIKRVELTEIEMVILNSILNKIYDIIRDHWKPGMTETPRTIQTETNLIRLNLMQPNDVILKLVFEVTVNQEVGLITFCIPYMAVESVLEKLLSIQKPRYKGKEDSNKIIKQNISDTKVFVKTLLGNLSLTVNEVLSLKEGDVLMTDLSKKSDVFIQIGDYQKFTGELGVANNKYAVKIKEVIID